MEKGRKGALGVGDRILARTEERGNGHVAYPMKRLQAGGEMVVGVLVTDTGPGGKPVTWLRPADQPARFDFAVSDLDWKSVVCGKSVSVRVDTGGARIHKK